MLNNIVKKIKTFIIENGDGTPEENKILLIDIGLRLFSEAVIASIYLMINSKGIEGLFQNNVFLLMIGSFGFLGRKLTKNYMKKQENSKKFDDSKNVIPSIN